MTRRFSSGGSYGGALLHWRKIYVSFIAKMGVKWSSALVCLGEEVICFFGIRCAFGANGSFCLLGCVVGWLAYSCFLKP